MVGEGSTTDGGLNPTMLSHGSSSLAGASRLKSPQWSSFFGDNDDDDADDDTDDNTDDDHATAQPFRLYSRAAPPRGLKVTSTIIPPPPPQPTVIAGGGLRLFPRPSDGTAVVVAGSNNTTGQGSRGASGATAFLSSFDSRYTVIGTNTAVPPTTKLNLTGGRLYQRPT